VGSAPRGVILNIKKKLYTYVYTHRFLSQILFYNKSRAINIRWTINVVSACTQHGLING
jgi:hypothetical protein